MYMKSLEPDSPLMEGFDLIKNLFFINIFTVLCCIPVVTIGAALSAMHYSCLKVVRNEEGYAAKMYFTAFKQNLKQGIPSSIISIGVVAFILFDFWYMVNIDTVARENGVELWFSAPVFVTLLIVSFFVVITLTWYFPVMAKFEATIVQNIKNSGRLGLSHILVTILMVVLNVIPFVICYFIQVLSPVLFIFGLSVPAYFGAKLYDKIFAKVEEKNV
ncbi:MAG: DUF624 domain-containing protein [Lachnospiraceae bacterium]|nr:DUF624 domain-containing protein [Lachnospiraceae bacterium]